MWKLLNFTDRDGNGIVKEWFSDQTVEMKATFLARMNALVKLPGDGWDRPDVGQLRHGDCKGLFEIVLFANDTQHRPLGYFSGKEEFTFLAFATEKGSKLLPKDICKTAKTRQKLVEDERVKEKKRVREFTLIKK